MEELSGSRSLIGLTITIGALPALPFLWFAEKIVDYCGHSNLLITAFTFYIIRYTGKSALLLSLCSHRVNNIYKRININFITTKKIYFYLIYVFI